MIEKLNARSNYDSDKEWNRENKSKESEKNGKEKKEKEGRSDKRRHLNRKERILPFWAKVKCFSSHILPSFSEVKVYKQKYLNKSVQHMLQAYFCPLAQIILLHCSVMHAQLTDISVNTAVHVLFLPCAREWRRQD